MRDIDLLQYGNQRKKDRLFIRLQGLGPLVSAAIAVSREDLTGNSFQIAQSCLQALTQHLRESSIISRMLGQSCFIGLDKDATNVLTRSLLKTVQEHKNALSGPESSYAIKILSHGTAWAIAELRNNVIKDAPYLENLTS